MRSIIFLVLLLLTFQSYSELRAQDNDTLTNDSLKQSAFLFIPMHYKSLVNPSEVDTAEALQRFTYLINNDVYQSLFLNPNRNTKRGDSGYDHSRTMNYKGIIMYNMYTLYNSRTDGVWRVNYWHTGSNKVSLSRAINVLF